MAEKKVVLTYEGLKNLEEELQELKIVKRKEIAEKIKEARAQGDLSENAEYDAAKEEQAEVESRIVTLEKMLRNAEIIDDEALDKDIVGIGSRVRIYDAKYDEELAYTIVGSTEADPFNGKVSNESPVGMAIIGHKVGDEINVTTPDGIIRCKVLSIE
jgi:transcription elongation factor GreA